MLYIKGFYDKYIDQNNETINPTNLIYVKDKDFILNINDEIKREFNNKNLKDNYNIEINKFSNLIDISNLKVGITNIKFSCLVNSCIQILCHNKLFIENLNNNYVNFVNDKNSISFLIYSILIDMNKKNIVSNSCIDISKFLYIFGLKHPNFGGYMQQDCQEFIRLLLEDINKELNEIKIKPNYEEIFYSENTTKEKRNLKYYNFYVLKEKSFIVDIFYTQSITTLICPYNFKSYYFQMTLDLPLFLPPNKMSIKISELIDFNFKEEFISLGNKFSNCKKSLRLKKLYKIAKPPKILILSFQRF